MTAALTLRVSSMLGELLHSLPLRATGQVADHEPPPTLCVARVGCRFILVLRLSWGKARQQPVVDLAVMATDGSAFDRPFLHLAAWSRCKSHALETMERAPTALMAPLRGRSRCPISVI